MDISPLTHGIAAVAGSIKNGLSAAWERVSFPIILGTPERYSIPEDGRTCVRLRNVFFLAGSVSLLTGESFPGKDIDIMVSSSRAEKMKIGKNYIAVCSPFHIRKDPSQRSLLLPIVRVW